MRVFKFLSQETNLRSRRLEQKFPFNPKVTSFLSRRTSFFSLNSGELQCHLSTPFQLKTIHALSYLKLFYVDSVLLDSDLTEETKTYIYIHAKMGCTKYNVKSNQITFIVTSPQHKCLGE